MGGNAGGKEETDSQDIMKAPPAYLTDPGKDGHTPSTGTPPHSDPDTVGGGGREESNIPSISGEGAEVEESLWASCGHSGATIQTQTLRRGQEDGTPEDLQVPKGHQ